MNKDEMKNRISLALKDPILQQGFEIICKENAKLKADNDARKFAMGMSEKVEKQLREENAKLKKEVLEVRQHLELTEIEWGKDTTKSIYFKTQLTKAKDIIEKLLNAFASNDFFEEEELNAMSEAEQFLKEVEK